MATAQDTLVARYNDLDTVEALFDLYPGQIAAVIVEPVAGNMGVVPPLAGFLPGLRQITSQHGALLIIDEVMTGFRVHPGGAQALYGIQPDLTTLGKVIGGGLPVGAYGGKREIMSLVAPSGPVYQAGTLSGNPLAMSAGLATLRVLQNPGTWAAMEVGVNNLTAGLASAAGEAGVPIQQTRSGTMFCTFFSDSPVYDWPSAKASDTARFGRFFQGMLSRGVYLAPSQFEAAFFSIAHTPAVVDRTIEAARETFNDL
jgi:glutamate-1-semialdehyde 2,1-aminomutase